MGESIALRQLDNLESLFAQADLTNNGTLTKEEVRVFVHRAVKEGIFSDFFQA